MSVTLRSAFPEDFPSGVAKDTIGGYTNDNKKLTPGGTMVSTYKVSGMTCGHCVNAVSTEVAKIDGVTGVDVKLDAGQVDVTSDSALDASTVQAAVEEAGFELVS